MGDKRSYGDLLKDPRWQRRRLEVLEQAGWACERCESTERTLHVHHRKYERGKLPWEYADDMLEVLCEGCHNERYQAERGLKESLPWIDSEHLWVLSGYATAALIDTTGNVAGDELFDVPSWEFAHGMAMLCRGYRFSGNTTAEDIIHLIPEGGKLRGTQLLKLINPTRTE